MTTVRVSEFELSRLVNPPTVHVSEFELSVNAPSGPGPTVRISDFSLSVGYEVPDSPGAVRVRVNGQWVPHVVKTRWNGAWV